MSARVHLNFLPAHLDLRRFSVVGGHSGQRALALHQRRAVNVDAVSRLVRGDFAITSQGVEAAYRRIDPSYVNGFVRARGLSPVGEVRHVRRTPLEAFPYLSERLGRPIYLKREDLQPVRSFKIRGAMNMLMRLMQQGIDPDQVIVGTASHGNHAQGVIAAAQMLGMPNIEIYLPTNVSPLKQRQCEAGGARVILVGETFEEAEDAVRRRSEENPFRYIFVPAFNHALVAMGQGTIGMEIGMDMSALSHKHFSVVVPTGGGGLAAGVSTLLAAADIPVYGVDSEAYPFNAQSLKAGHIVRPADLSHRDTLADGAALLLIGKVPFRALQRHIRDIVVVREDDISQAIYDLRRQGLLVEGSAASPVAALVSGALTIPGDDPVVLVVTGKNIDESVLGQVLRQHEPQPALAIP